MEEAIRKLLQGFCNFHEVYFARNRRMFERLQHGQQPKVLVIACSDSRVDPALLLHCDPGDIFVIRNVANLVPPYESGSGLHHGVSAALEYAVRTLQVEHIIVLGHSDCGGIRALMRRDDSRSTGEFLDTWLDLAEPAKQATLAAMPEAGAESRHRACEEASLVLGLKNLMTFPWVAERVESGVLSLHAWYFHLNGGRLYEFDPEVRGFKLLPLE